MSASSAPVFVKESIGWSIALSVLMILAGMAAIIVPPLAGIAVAILLAWLLVLGGLAHLVFAWHTRTHGVMVWGMILGILYIAVGVFLFVRPIVALASLTLLLACYLLAEGVLEFILWFRMKHFPGGGWLLFDGIITVIVGMLIWMTWPSNTDWVIGTLVGISILFSGVSRLALSLRARSLTA